MLIRNFFIISKDIILIMFLSKTDLTEVYIFLHTEDIVNILCVYVHRCISISYNTI